MNKMQIIIKEICEEKGINYDLVSKDWIMVLTKGNKTRYIAGYKFDLNDHGVGQICDDKYALFDVLRKFNIPVAECFILFKNYDKGLVEEYAKKYDYNLVVKSNTSTCGNDMYHTLNKDELFTAIDKLLLNNFSISICPYYEIKNEYRVVYLNGKVELLYKKIKPIVIGNGKNTIYELLCDFNKPYFEKLNNDEDLTRVLNENEVYEYNWQFNLSKGASLSFIEDNELENKLNELAFNTARTINLSFASIDIIELESGELLVLEVNSGVMMENFVKLVPNGEKIAKNIYKKAVEEMFK